MVEMMTDQALFLKGPTMTSEKQRLANRRNAKASTGPKTAAGRAKSSRNSLKHGMTASQVTLDDEDPAEFAAYRQCLCEALKPVGALEELLADRCVVCGWRLRRPCRMEARLHASERIAAGFDFCTSQLAEADRLEASLSDGTAHSEEDADQLREIIRNKRKAAGELSLLYEGKEFPGFGNTGSVLHRSTKLSAIDAIVRYETSIERSFYRALHNLERAQARRKGETVAAPLAVDIANKN
jgi:hypothetical protein